MTMKLDNYKDKLYWLIPAISYLILSFFSLINVDGVRDYLEAYSIATTSDFTLVGPQMAFSFHVAPLWYYFLSIPLFFSKSWMVLSVFITLLTVFKFYFAYKLGKLLIGKDYAIFLISSMLLASFTLIQLITFTHTNLIEASIIYIIYFCFTFDKNSPKMWFILGILIAISLHIHPTTAVTAYWILPKLFQSKYRLRNLFICGIGFIIPFLPIIFHEFSTDFENFKGVMQYLSTKTNAHDYLGPFKLAFGVIFTTAYDIYEMLFPPFLAKITFAIHALFVLAIIILALYSLKNQDIKTKKLFFQFFGFWVFTLVLISLIRLNTPWYMTYSISLSFSLLFALCLWMVYKTYSFKSMPSTVYLLTLLVFMALFLLLGIKLNTNKLYVHGEAWNNIKTLSTKQFNVTGFEIPAYQSHAHSKYLCQHKLNSLHGPYATLIHSHSGIELLSTCPNNRIWYGNAENTNKIFAIPGIFAKYIKQKAIKKIGDAYFYPVKSISNQQLITEEDFKSEYKRKYIKQPEWLNKDISVVLDKGKNLVITKLFGSFSTISIKEVRLNGKIINPVEKTNYATFYACNSCDGKKSNWEIVFSESDSGSTNIVSF